MRARHIGVLFTATCLMTGCAEDADSSVAQDQALRMNEIQVLGTHNSYHIQPRD